MDEQRKEKLLQIIDSIIKNDDEATQSIFHDHLASLMREKTGHAPLPTFTPVSNDADDFEPEIDE